MSKSVKTLVTIGIVLVILAGAVSVYAANGSERVGAGNAENITQEAPARFNGAQPRDVDDDERKPNPVGRGTGTMGANRGGIIADYAAITDQNWDDVLDAMRDSDLTIWELAEQQGNFEALKGELLEDLDAHIALVSDEDELAELTAHRDAVAAATTAAEMPEDYDGYTDSMGARGGRRR